MNRILNGEPISYRFIAHIDPLRSRFKILQVFFFKRLKLSNALSNCKYLTALDILAIFGDLNQSLESFTSKLTSLRTG